jgi:multicomponent Na+:H+ antiporter subunit E
VTARLRDRLPRVVWLVVVWVLLWGTFTPLTVLGGVLVAVAVTLVLPMPPASERLPVRPLRFVGLVGYLVYDLVVSTVEVSWHTLRHGPGARGAIVEAPLHSGSDRVVTVMAAALSLSPGTAVLEIDQERGAWFVYALGPRDAAGVGRARRRIADMQRRVLAAFGSAEDIRSLQDRAQWDRAPEEAG